MRIIKIILTIIGVVFLIVVATGLFIPTFEYGNSNDGTLNMKLNSK